LIWQIELSRVRIPTIHLAITLDVTTLLGYPLS